MVYVYLENSAIIISRANKISNQIFLLSIAIQFPIIYCYWLLRNEMSELFQGKPRFYRFFEICELKESFKNFSSPPLVFLLTSQDFLFTTNFYYEDFFSWPETSWEKLPDNYFGWCCCRFALASLSTHEILFLRHFCEKSRRKKSKEVRSEGKKMNHAPAPFFSVAKGKRLKIFVSSCDFFTSF